MWTCCCSTRPGTITLGNRQATEFLPAPGVDVGRACRRGPTGLAGRRDARGAQHRGSGQEQYGLRGRDLEALGAAFVPFTAQTRMSGVDLDGRRIRKGAADAVEAYVQRRRAASLPARSSTPSTPSPDREAHRSWSPTEPGSWGCPSEGHRQGRHQGAVPRSAPHGDQDGHDHRRQPRHGRLDRRRGGGGRLPRRGHSRGQARADPRATRPKDTWWP